MWDLAVWLNQLLRTEAFASARPDILVQGAPRPVRWVHSSEIYAIGPLLEGGEVLLTSGLGLAGCDDSSLTNYVESIAEPGAAALVLELGRTFLRAPPALVRACERTELTLVALHAIVPWVRITRSANEIILDHDAGRLRRADEITVSLIAVLLEGQGLRAIIDLLDTLTRTSTRVVTTDGQLVAGTASTSEPTCRVPLELLGRPWGDLVADDTGDPNLVETLQRAAVAVQLALLRAPATQHTRADARRALVLDLFRGSVVGREQIVARAAAIGLSPDRPSVAVIVSLTDLTPRDALEPVGRGLSAGARTDLLTDTEDSIVAVCGVDIADQIEASQMLSALDRELEHSGGSIRQVAVGRPARHLADITASFTSARAALRLGRQLGTEQRWLTHRDLALAEFLSAVDDLPLEQLIDQLLGALIVYDSQNRHPLFPTLLAYLSAGRSKTAAASVLGIRRQSLYDRLKRIIGLLDVDLDDPLQATSLHVACLGWQLRGTGHRGHA